MSHVGLSLALLPGPCGQLLLLPGLGSQRLSAEELRVIADLPPLPQLQGKLLGLLQAPAQKLVALINTPGSQLARVIKAKADKGE